MAGYMYLGSQKVCPAILLGGGESVRNGLEPDQNGKLSWVTSGNLVFSGFTDIGERVFSGTFSGSEITSVDLSNLEEISGSQACSSMFGGCFQLISVNLSNLKTISGGSACWNMFTTCRQLTSVDLSSLETISGVNACVNMFANCILLEHLRFSSLKTISKTNAFSGLVNRCSGVTIHFPSNMESIIQGLDGYPNFGGTNTTLLFDLPAVNL